ncbi:MAG TPA: FkbM family methyltransferase [Phycisphaerales bacterium]|nr:FkbM family methyltransferase [Phycisphaerales bacterium]
MITLRGHTFLPAPIGPGSLVVDLGANTGDFSRQVRARYGCRVCAVEANPDLVPKVRAIEGVEVIHAAAVGRRGPIEFRLSDDILASSVCDLRPGVANGRVVTVEGLTLPDILARFGLALSPTGQRLDLLKVDIEGAEVGLIMNAPDELLRSIDQITLEFHDFCGLNTADEIVQVCRRLKSLGFDGFRFGIDNTNWLFARRGLKGVGALRRWYATQLIRNVRNALHWGRGKLGLHNLGLGDDHAPQAPAAS